MTQAAGVPTLPPTAHTPSAIQTGVMGRQIHVDENGDLADARAWNAQIAEVLSTQAGIIMTAEHRSVIAAVRLDFEETGETPTLLRTSRITGLDAGRLYELFHSTPAATMAHIAGLRARRARPVTG